MFNGLLLYFLFLVGSHVILKFLVYLPYFFLCCRISILPIIAYRHVLISNLSSSLYFMQHARCLIFRLQQGI